MRMKVVAAVVATAFAMGMIGGFASLAKDGGQRPGHMGIQMGGDGTI